MVPTAAVSVSSPETMEASFMEATQMISDVGVKEMSGMRSSGTVDVPQDEDQSRMYVLAGICIIVLCLLLSALLISLIFVRDRSRASSTGSDDTDETTPITPGVSRIRPTARRTTGMTVVAPTGTTPPTQGTSRSITASQATATTSSTIRTTTEDTFQFMADYNKPVYNDVHNFACLFNASKQGFRAFGRTYGIGYFPFQVCHILLYCCYRLTSTMTFEPQNPAVDLPPRDALKRATGFKQTNTWLWTYLVLEGSDANFEKLMVNRSGEVNEFRDYAVNWLANYNYDGIRILWRNTPAGRSANIFNFSTLVAAALYQYKRSLGYFVPYEENLRRAYDLFALQRALLVPYTIMLYRASPLDLPTRAKWLTYQDVRYTDQLLNTTVRNMLCHMFSLQWLSFKINDSLCTSTMLRSGRSAVIDWGQPGPLTQTRGRLSLYEVCDMTSGTAWTRGRLMRSNFACKDSDVLTGLDDTVASGWIKRELHDPSNGICFGYMDPENDDFPGRCNRNNPYPLIRGMFQHFIHGKAQSGGRVDINLPLLNDIPANFG